MSVFLVCVPRHHHQEISTHANENLYGQRTESMFELTRCSFGGHSLDNFLRLHKGMFCFDIGFMKGGTQAWELESG
jgi:hypothetical protein